MTARWTEEQLASHLSKATAPPFKLPPNEPGAFALGRLPLGKMNKTEAAYDNHLQSLRHAGKILWHKFEAIKLRLADATFYTPDFAVLSSDCVMELHEVKGFMMDDANVKIKVAASMYPFRFKLVRKRSSGWVVNEIGEPPDPATSFLQDQLRRASK